MPPVHEWPPMYSRLLLGKHLGYNDRANLIPWMLGNGCLPLLIARWARAQKGWLRHRGSCYDACNLIKKHMHGEYEGRGASFKIKEIYSMEHDRKITCYTPNFAREDVGHRRVDPLTKTCYIEPAGHQFWLDACHELAMLANTLPSEKHLERAL